MAEYVYLLSKLLNLPNAKPNLSIIDRTRHLFVSRTSWRNMCRKQLETNQECDLVKLLNHTSILSKKSASNSIGLTGEFQNDPMPQLSSNIIIKASFKDENILENGLIVERQIYQNIISNLLNHNHTPCLMDYLGHYMCDTKLIIQSLPEEQKKQFIEQLNNIKHGRDLENEKLKYELRHDINVNKTELLFLIKSPGIILHEWLNPTRSLSDVLSVFFQILYTLKCFKNLTLRHNDLHWGNLFIEQFDEPIVMFFATNNNKYIKLTTKYIVKIYDFDRSSIYHPAVNRNISLDLYFCMSYGQCNMPSDKYDLYRLINLYHYFAKESFSLSVHQEIKNKWMVEVIDWNWYISRIDQGDHWYYLNYKHIHGAKLKSLSTALSIFVNAKWSEKPFEVLDKIPDNIPSEIIFTLPHAVKFHADHPINRETCQALSRTIPKISTVYDLRYLRKIWDQEMINFGFNEQDMQNMIRNIYDKVKDIKLGRLEFVYRENYIAVISMMIYPMWHSLSSDLKQALTSRDFMLIESDIWNILGNRLPIQLPIL